MIKNIPEIEALLQAGGTLLVPSRQRAVAIRLAYAHARLAEGARGWVAPDVLTLDAWLQRCVDSSRLQRLRGGRRLGPHEEWLGWRVAAREAGEGLGLLQPVALADALREAARLQRNWGLASPRHEGPEGQVYELALSSFRALCQARDAVAADDWQRLLEGASPAGQPLAWAGFESLGRALQGRLEALGARPLAPAAAVGGTAADRVVQARDLDDELQQAARWSRERLSADPQARLLVVVPQLAQCRARVARCFARELLGAALLSDEAPEALHALEGGQPLADYPLVQAALALLAALGGELAFASQSTWLRSPYLALGGLPARIALELRLRERNHMRAGLARLRALAGDSPLGTSLAILAAAAATELGARRDASAWAPLLASWLEAAGWPGEAALGSEEQQQRQRFEELLGEFAQLGATAGRLRCADAVALLAQLALRTPYEPATGDVPVTITASTGDPLVHYDGIWIAGLNAEQWPRPARPDAFLGVAAQRAAGIPEASAEGQAGIARAAMAAWRLRAGELVHSCSRVEGDTVLQPSSLLGLGAPPKEPGPLPAAAPDALRAALQASRRRESLPARPATPLAAGESLPGGTRALGLQAECPFHAFAELRLGARTLLEPVQGLTAFERGNLLHSALQRTWEQLGGSQGLRACVGAQRAALAGSAASGALADLRAAVAPDVPEAIYAIEARRLQRLVLELLAAEEARPPFVVAGLETVHAGELGGVPIEVRVDRCDELLDAEGRRSGQVVVLDYKSGEVAAFDPLSERPRHAQLLAYSRLVAGEVMGIAFVHLRKGRAQWRGAVAARELLPGLAKGAAAGPLWPAWRTHWGHVVERLARQLADGEAPVDPLATACRSCHLEALCRVGQARHELGSEQAEDEGAEAETTTEGGADD